MSSQAQISYMVLSPRRLESILQWPHLRAFWPFLSAAVLTVNNRPEEIPVLYEYMQQHCVAHEHARITREMQEGIMKTAGLCGLPKVINSLTSLKECTPSELRAREPLRSSEHDYAADGTELFEKVYGKITQRVLGNMRNAYPDLPFYAVNCLYGPLFSPTSGLGAKETCLVIVAALIPQNVIPQLKGHLKGALNCGATQDEVDATCALSKQITAWCTQDQ